LNDIERNLRLAYAYASAFSDDPATHNGAVLVTENGETILGTNHLPIGVAHTAQRFERPPSTPSWSTPNAT